MTTTTTASSSSEKMGGEQKVMVGSLEFCIKTGGQLEVKVVGREESACESRKSSPLVAFMRCPSNEPSSFTQGDGTVA